MSYTAQINVQLCVLLHILQCKWRFVGCFLNLEKSCKFIWIVCESLCRFVEHKQNQHTMKKYFKLESGDRVKVLTGKYAGREGTIDHNRHVSYLILLDGETRPANLCGREFYCISEYKKNLIKL